MTVKIETNVAKLKINRLKQHQFDNISTLESNELYLVDPEFTGNKVLATDSYGDVIESDINVPTLSDTSKFLRGDGTWQTVSSGDALPSQTGQSGKFLTTNGTTASWANTPTEIPSQTGNSGKYLTTNGTSVSWAAVDALPSQTGQSGKYLTTNGTAASWINISIPTVDQTYSGTSTNAQSGTAVKEAIDAAISSTYKAAGSVTFANLPVLGVSYEGYVYNVSDSFTTTADFIEGAGKTYPAGTNVVCINTSGSTYKWDVLAGFIDLSEYQTKIDSSHKLSADLVDDTSTTNKFVTASDKTTWSGKQDALVSGTNIKTINSTSILGSGNITIDSLPSQSGNSGKYLTTDGTTASWGSTTSASVSELKTINGTSILGSGNITTTELPSQSGQSGKFLTTNGTTVSWGNAQTTANLVTSVSSSSTDTQYPSAKCVYDLIGTIEAALAEI